MVDFETRWTDRILDLEEHLLAGTYRPRPSIYMIAANPKAREIHAPDFCDRVMHHWLVPMLEWIYDRKFAFHSFSNRIGKGTHAAVEWVQRYVRQVDSGQGGGWYLQLDIKNFFNSIYRPRLWVALKRQMVRAGLPEYVIQAAHALLRHPNRHHGIIDRTTPEQRAMVPAHKRLDNAPAGCGIAIGNYSSQFLANVVLDALDQFVKHVLKVKRYVRYVDDFILFHASREQLQIWKDRIERFLQDKLRLELKSDVRLRPLRSGIDFLGYVIFPTHTRVRRRVVQHAREKLSAWAAAHVDRESRKATATPEQYEKLRAIWASYRGHFQHANAWRLQLQLRARFPWLGALVDNRRRFDDRLSGRPVTLMVPA